MFKSDSESHLAWDYERNSETAPRHLINLPGSENMEV